MKIWTPSTLSRIFYYTSLIRTTIFEFYEERYFGTSLVKITPFHTYYKCKIFSIYPVRKPFLVPRPLIQARQVQTMTWGLRPYSLVPSYVTGVPAVSRSLWSGSLLCELGYQLLPGAYGSLLCDWGTSCWSGSLLCDPGTSCSQEPSSKYSLPQSWLSSWQPEI